MARVSRIQGLVIAITIELCLATAAAEFLQKTTFGVLLPFTSRTTLRRKYLNTVQIARESFIRDKFRKFNFTTKYNVPAAVVDFVPHNPTPIETLNLLCETLDYKNVIAIVYMTNAESYGKAAASTQYLLQLTGYLGVPVIAWNEDNIGLKQRMSESMVLQLAPSVEHQLDAMLSILRRYSWHQFSVVTSQVSGYDEFVRAIRDRVIASTDFTFTIIDIFTLKRRKREELVIELEALAKSEARVILLYCTRDEAAEIMAAANDLKITGKNYMWIVTQAVIDSVIEVGPSSFPPGMLGVHFNATTDRLQDEIERAFSVLVHGLELFFNDPHNANITLTSLLTCNGTGDTMWASGARFLRYLRSVSVKKRGRPVLRFNPDGTLTHAELEVMNLNQRRYWDKVGSWTENELIIKDIVWPGGSTTPPAGLPEKFNLKVTFMDEPPYVNIAPPDEETGECKTRRAVKCLIKPIEEVTRFNSTTGTKIYNHYNCCAGFCIDLLQKFANDLGFTYDLYRVEDGKWGAYHNGSWNGLIAELLNHKADIVVTSFKINSERQSAVDFTVPFLETGIAIVVAKRTGIISPKAFLGLFIIDRRGFNNNYGDLQGIYKERSYGMQLLEPFDTISWIMILLICIQFSAIAIFLFEWLSPSGYNMHTMPPRDENDPSKNHKFSLFRTYWLVWAILFGAAVNVDCPRGYTARFMSNVWAMFAVVFLAIYTANLAAFMITREEYYDLTGIEDKLLKYPTMVDPPFSYGTIPHGNTEAVLKKNKPDLYRYMKKHNRPSVKEGIKAVKTGKLHAFIYDSTVLEYWVGQDNECRLLTVGSWYAMTGYGFALPKNSKYLNMFNSEMIKYRENGDLERLQRFWLQGACKPTKHKRHVSKPLDINQFMSAFLLLGCGVLLTILVLGLEHLYFRYVRKHLPKKDKGGFFTLISMSIGKSLSFRGAVFEAQDVIKHHRCKDPICDTQLWKTRHELDMARLRIRQLEAEIEKRSSGDKYFHSHDITRYGGINDSCLPAPPRYVFCRTPSTTEVAEIETVL